MRFSIIVPVFNSETYLDDCVNSVTGQSFSDWELLLVDDGSTDASGKLVDEFAAKDDRIRAIHQTNAGQFFARQAGICQARGDYLLFLDSDDQFVEGALFAIYALLEQEEWDLVLFLGQEFGLEVLQGGTIGLLEAPAGEVEIASIRRIVASSERLNSLCLKAFNRRLFLDDEADYGCLRDIRHGEDKAMLLHPLTCARRCCYLPRVLYRYRRNMASATHNLALDDVPSLLGNAVFSLTHRAMAEWGLTSRADERAFGANYLRNFIAAYFNLRKAQTSRKDRKALRRYPWRDALDRRYFRLDCMGELNPRDCIKLVCAWLRM